MQNFRTIGQPLLGEKYVIPKMVENTFPLQHPRGAHALCSDQFKFQKRGHLTEKEVKEISLRTLLRLWTLEVWKMTGWREWRDYSV